MSAVARRLRAWLPLGAAITVLALAALVAWHGELRAAADEPQRSLAMDAARALDAGRGAAAFLPPRIDLEVGEGVFLAGYDTAGTPAWASARLHGALPAPPPGVFRHADDGPHRLSWMPEPGIREALVIVALRGHAGYVVAGRSLHEAEARKAGVVRLWLVAWLLAMASSLALALAAGAPRRP